MKKSTALVERCGSGLCNCKKFKKSENKAKLSKAIKRKIFKVKPGEDVRFFYFYKPFPVLNITHGSEMSFCEDGPIVIKNDMMVRFSEKLQEYAKKVKHYSEVLHNGVVVACVVRTKGEGLDRYNYNVGFSYISDDSVHKWNYETKHMLKQYAYDRAFKHVDTLHPNDNKYFNIPDYKRKMHDSRYIAFEVFTALPDKFKPFFIRGWELNDMATRLPVWSLLMADKLITLSL